MKKKRPQWVTYWNNVEDLNYLVNAYQNISHTYSEIKNEIGRTLMSEELLEIQESLEQRIDELQKKSQKIAA
jgi:hypothetical protein